VTETANPRDASGIASYHAHIYYDAVATREQAGRVRAWIAERFPTAQIGRWHDAPVGPHPRAMFQAAFAAGLFPTFVPWLMLNRLGLAVLVHPNTDRPRDDHLIHALWLGEMLPLDAEVLPLTAAASVD
jgi:aromatic ring-cleaving dioxygenase